jgi:hypothetical protein
MFALGFARKVLRATYLATKREGQAWGCDLSVNRFANFLSVLRFRTASRWQSSDISHRRGSNRPS